MLKISTNRIPPNPSPSIIIPLLDYFLYHIPWYNFAVDTSYSSWKYMPASTMIPRPITNPPTWERGSHSLCCNSATSRINRSCCRICWVPCQRNRCNGYILRSIAIFIVVIVLPIVRNVAEISLLFVRTNSGTPPPSSISPSEAPLVHLCSHFPWSCGNSKIAVRITPFILQRSWVILQP